MSEGTDTVAWPLIEVTIYDDGRAEIDRLGTVHTLGPAGSTDAAREAVRLWIADNVARPAGRAVAVTIDDPDGRWHVAVTPTGDAQPSTHGKDKPRRRPTAGRPRPATDPGAAPPQDHHLSNEPAAASDTTQTDPGPRPPPALPPAPAPEADPQADRSGPDTRARYRAESADRPVRSFLTDTVTVDPAEHGWRGFLARLGFRTKPSPAELAQRDDQRAIAQHWPGPRTIAVVNAKGGAGKTPTTVILSAMFARAGGSGVLAWDNNETRGTLGWRTEQGPHEAHVLDLLPHAEQLLAPTARAADLSAFLHHQTADMYDVLRSNPRMLAAEQRITDADFDAVHGVATKYFRLIFVDSGNDESAPHWLRMIDRADQIVLPTTTRAEHAETGLLLLEALHDRDERSAHLADNAVVIVSQADKTERDATAIAAGFEGLARTAVTVPYDPALRETWLRVRALSPGSQRAWLAAAAAVARGL